MSFQAVVVMSKRMDCDPWESVPSRVPMGSQETKEPEEDMIKNEGRLIFDSPYFSVKKLSHTNKSV